MSLGDEQRGQADAVAFLRFFLVVIIAAGGLGTASWFASGNAVLAFLLALSVGTILLMIEVRFRLAVSKETLARGLALKEQTNRLPEANRAGLWQAVTDYSHVRNAGNRLARDRATELLAAFGTELGRLREGTLEVSLQHSYGYFTRMYEEVERSLFATLMVRLADMWFRPNPEDYINTNLRALARGVKVTRVFILQGLSDLSDDVVDIIRRLTKAGAEIRIALEEQLAPELLIDMFLVDDRVVVYTEMAPGDRARSCQLHVNEVDVQNGRLLQERLLRDSSPATEFLARYVPTAAPPAPVPGNIRGGAPA